MLTYYNMLEEGKIQGHSDIWWSVCNLFSMDQKYDV